jgi:hypothetical protein
LFRALLASDPEHWNNSPHNASNNPHAPSIWTLDEIRANLIRRELVDVEPLTMDKQSSQPRIFGSNLLDNRAVATRAWLETPDGHLLYLLTAPLVFVPTSPIARTTTTTTTTVTATTEATVTVTTIVGEPDGQQGEGEVSPESVSPPSDNSSSEMAMAITTGDHEDMQDATADVHVQAAMSTARNSTSDEGDEHDNEASSSSSSSSSAPTSVDFDYSSSGHDHNNDNGDDDDDDDEDHCHLHGSTCDICLLSYQRGDIVAWSRNPDCPHYFHEDCIIDWLRRKPTCCSCRRDYVVIAPEQTAVKLQVQQLPIEGTGTDEHV